MEKSQVVTADIDCKSGDKLTQDWLFHKFSSIEMLLLLPTILASFRNVVVGLKYCINILPPFTLPFLTLYYQILPYLTKLNNSQL